MGHLSAPGRRTCARLPVASSRRAEKSGVTENGLLIGADRLTPPYTRTNSDDSRKDACKVALIGETAGQRDLGKRMLSVTEHCLRRIDPSRQKPAVWGDPC